MGKFGITEILVIAFVVLLLFGGRKIPELMRGLGQGVKEFKNASNGDSAAPKRENETKGEGERQQSCWRRASLGPGMLGQQSQQTPVQLQTRSSCLGMLLGTPGALHQIGWIRLFGTSVTCLLGKFLRWTRLPCAVAWPSLMRGRRWK